MFEHILVVCTGNICRSPVGAAMLAQALPNLRIESAGVKALDGEGVAAEARALAEADGLEVAAHVARTVTPSMISTAELVLVMSDRQRRAVTAPVPETLGKVMLFGHWLATEPSGREIPDPYGRSPEVFRIVHEQLWNASRAWIERLRQR